MDEQGVRLRFQVDTNEVATGKARVDALKEEIADLRSAMDRGAVGGERYREELKRLESDLKRAERAADDAGESIGTGRGNKGLAQGLLQGSRAIQDYSAAGMAGAINNIEGLALAMGLGSGLAGVATVAAVALGAFGDDLKNLLMQSDQVRGFTSRVEELKSGIKDLEDKKVKVGIDADSLERMKAELKQLEEQAENVRKLLSGQAQFERESGQKIRSAIIETHGGQEAVAAARAALTREAMAPFEAGVTSAQNELENARNRLELLKKANVPVTDIFKQKAEVDRLEKVVAEKEALRARRANDVQQRVNATIDAAEKGTGAVQEQAQAALANALVQYGGAAGQELAVRIGAASPRALQADASRNEAMKRIEQKRADDQKEAARLEKERLERKEAARLEKERLEREEAEGDRWFNEQMAPYEDRARAVDRRDAARAAAARSGKQLEQDQSRAPELLVAIRQQMLRLEEENAELRRMLQMGAGTTAQGIQMLARQQATIDALGVQLWQNQRELQTIWNRNRSRQLPRTNQRWK